MINLIKKKIYNAIRRHETGVLIKKVAPYTMVTPDRLANLIRLAQYVNENGIDGDFIECGVYKGGSAAILSKYMGDNRRLWLYDSFEGLPDVTAKDEQDAKDYIGKFASSAENVKEVMRLVSTKEDRYMIKKGWFRETFREALPQSIALLHCDADWYESVTMVLDTFYRLVPTGGCVIMDDFGYWEGAREAFYDFCGRNNEKPLLERCGDSAYWIKDKSTVRRRKPSGI